jgi:serine/threonine protein kinase
MTVNSDREYFIEGDRFIKIDTVPSRGQNEANILSSIHHPLVQIYKKSYIEGDVHVLETEYFEGETLENMNSSLSPSERRSIEHQLFSVFVYMMEKEIVHGDINVSNILYDGEKILLIDWETAHEGDTLDDLYGPPAPTNHCGILNVLAALRKQT